MLGRLFKRSRKPADPNDRAEKDRQRREAEKARHRAEAEVVDQRGWIDSKEPPFGGGFPY